MIELGENLVCLWGNIKSHLKAVEELMEARDVYRSSEEDDSFGKSCTAWEMIFYAVDTEFSVTFSAAFAWAEPVICSI